MGDYSDYLELRQQEEAEVEAARRAEREKAAAPAPAAARSEEEPRWKAQLKEQREYEQIEGVIAGLEDEVARLAKAMEEAVTDYARLQGLSAEHARAEAELSRALDRWAELIEIVEAIEREKQSRQSGR